MIQKKKFRDVFEYELLNENQQVADLRNKLADLYSSPFSDILLWELYDPALAKNGYYKLLYYEHSALKHIILFNYSAGKKRKIIVFNKEFNISFTNIENICKILFYEFNKLQQIVFEKIFEPTQMQGHRMIFEKTSNDVIIQNLPQTMETYMKSLGSTTRKSFRNSQNRLEKDNINYKISFYEGENISREQMNALVKFNRDKLKDMGIISCLNDTESDVMYQYASTSGFGCICECTVDDEIICGDFFTVIGEHAYMHFGGYDNLYHKYSIGRINLINITKYLIEKNIKHQHLLCGEQEYKFSHGGVNHDLYNLRVFRHNNIFYLKGIISGSIRNNCNTLRQKLANNKIVYNFYRKLKFLIKSIK